MMTAAKINVIERIESSIEDIDKWLSHEGSESTRELLNNTRRVLTMAKSRIEHQDALRIATPTVRDAYRQAALQGLLAREIPGSPDHVAGIVDEYVKAMMESR